MPYFTDLRDAIDQNRSALSRLIDRGFDYVTVEEKRVNLWIARRNVVIAINNDILGDYQEAAAQLKGIRDRTAVLKAQIDNIIDVANAATEVFALADQLIAMAAAVA